MSEQEAGTLACQFLDENQIEYETIERAFFTPVSLYEYAPPWLKDSWTVHFRVPHRSECNDDEAGISLSGGSLIIVSVDPETRSASLVSTL